MDETEEKAAQEGKGRIERNDMEQERNVPAEVAEEQIDQELAEAMSLHGKILAGGQVLAQSLVEFARRLKEMRDRRLYRRLGCESFEEYVESRVGLRQRQAYTYISTLERLGPQLMEQNAGLGITKLQLLSQITGPDREDFARENDLAGMSVAEVEALVKRANDQGQQLSMFAEELEDAKAQEANYKKLYEQVMAEMEQRVAEQAAQARSQAWEEAKAEVTRAQSQAADAARVEMAGRLEEERRARQEAERKAKEARQKAKDAQKMLESRDEEMFRKVEAAREEGFARGRSQAAQDALADRQRAEKEQEVASDRQTGRFALLFEQLQRCIAEMEEILEQLRRQGREDQAEKLARAREQALAAVMGGGKQ